VGIAPVLTELPTGRAGICSVFWIVTPATCAFIIDAQSRPAADAKAALPATNNASTNNLLPFSFINFL
jgi:hypothetical protein